MISPMQVFEESLAWLRAHYQDWRFFCERDVVWIVQTRLIEFINEQKLPYQVFNDYPMLPGPRRGFSADLVIMQGADVAVAVEFKYEPRHTRADILRPKLPVVGWADVGRDIERIYEFVRQQKTQTGCAVFIDEGGYFRHRPGFPYGAWQEWDNGVHVFYASTGAISS
jgi:hypothetical protein